MSYGDLSCQNTDSKIETKNLDQLANQGIRFSDAHAPSAVCTPTRYSILTGRYCWRSRLKSGVLYGYSKHLLEKGRLTVASMLQKQDYHTVAIKGTRWPLSQISRFNPHRGPIL